MARAKETCQVHVQLHYIMQHISPAHINFEWVRDQSLIPHAHEHHCQTNDHTSAHVFFIWKGESDIYPLYSPSPPYISDYTMSIGVKNKLLVFAVG